MAPLPERIFLFPFMTHAFEVTEKAKKDLFSASTSTGRPVRRSSGDPSSHYMPSSPLLKKKQGSGRPEHELQPPRPAYGQRPRRRCQPSALGVRGCLGPGPFLVKRKGLPAPYRKRLPWSTDEIIKKWEPFDERLIRIREKRKKRDRSRFSM